MTQRNPERALRYHQRRVVAEYSRSLHRAPDAATRALIWETLGLLHPDAEPLMGWGQPTWDWRPPQTPTYEFAFERLPTSKPMHEEGQWGGSQAQAQQVADLYQVRVILTRNGQVVGRPTFPRRERT